MAINNNIYTMLEKKKIGFWVPESKLKKINWSEFEKVCDSYGYEPFKLDLDTDLASQGNIHILLCKLTDVIALANEGDEKSSIIINMIENYIFGHPELIVLDPISNVRKLLNRYKTYSAIDSTDLYKYGVFIPTYCEINSNSIDKIEEQLELRNVSFPLICKHILGHGPRQVHDMFIVFNRNNLDLCKPPCVVQSFVNHNATLYKIYIIGNEYCYINRPSLKNFYPGNENPIFFSTQDVSRADSQSKLSVLDKADEVIPQNRPNPFVLEKIGFTLRNVFNVDLLGIDVIIENYTGRYAIIDVNAFPSYDEYPNYYHALINCVKEKERLHNLHNSNTYKE